MKRVYLVRHGESKAQTGEELSLDAGLSAEGVRQAKKLRNILPEIKFDAIYLSPLKRARQTFEYSGTPHEKVRFDSRLAEVLPYESYASMLPYQKNFGYGKPDIHDAWTLDPFERIAEFISSLYRTKAKSILVLGHAVALSNFLNVFLQRDNSAGIDGNSFKYSLMNNASVSVIEIAEKSDRNNCDKLLLWNYTGHIRKKGFFGA